MFKLFALVVLIGQQNVWAQIGIGPLDLNLIKSSKCDGDQGLLNVDIVTIDENTKGLKIDLDLPFPLDDTVSYTARVDKIQFGQIQKGVFNHGGADVCNDFDKFLGQLWAKIVAATGMPEGCPKEPGKYSTENMPFDNNDVGLDQFLYGRFLLNIEMMKDGETKTCFVIEFTNGESG